MERMYPKRCVRPFVGPAAESSGKREWISVIEGRAATGETESCDLNSKRLLEAFNSIACHFNGSRRSQYC